MPLAHGKSGKSSVDGVSLADSLSVFLQCSFLEHRNYKVIYRRYASLYFIIGIDIDDDVNELSLLEFIHNMVETLDKYFENVCELDVSVDLSQPSRVLLPHPVV